MLPPFVLSPHSCLVDLKRCRLRFGGPQSRSKTRAHQGVRSGDPEFAATRQAACNAQCQRRRALSRGAAARRRPSPLPLAQPPVMSAGGVAASRLQEERKLWRKVGQSDCLGSWVLTSDRWLRCCPPMCRSRPRRERLRPAADTCPHPTHPHPPHTRTTHLALSPSRKHAPTAQATCSSGAAASPARLGLAGRAGCFR